MKIVECTVQDGFSFLPKQPDIDRSKGLHLTDIIKDIMVTSGMMEDGGPFMPNLRTEMGFIWEDLISAVLRERTPCRPGEISLDGIAMSPDGFDWEGWILWEYKATWKSSNRSPLDDWRWMAQVKSYCKGMGCTQCKMWVLYVNGDYKGQGPSSQLFTIDFTQQEIDENWEMIINHARSKGWIE